MSNKQASSKKLSSTDEPQCGPLQIDNNKLSQELLAIALDYCADGIIITDRHNRIVHVNDRFCTFTGFSRSDLIGELPQILKSGEHDDEFYENLWAAIKEAGAWHGDIRNKNKAGEPVHFQVHIRQIKDEAGEAQYHLGVYRDITELSTTSEALNRLAGWDPLTGLPNRTIILDRITQAVIHAQRAKGIVGVMFVDIDHFKHINDVLGHLVGDELLQRVADRLLGCVRASDTVSRIGGDEFVIVLNDIGDEMNCGQLADKIGRVVSQPLHIEHHDIQVSASIGIALYPKDADSGDALLQAADNALSAAKRGGRDQYKFFTRSLSEATHRRLELEHEMRGAIPRKEFTLHYQPIVEAHSGRMVAAEALLRWKNEKLGWVPPSEFIPIAEDSGQIEQIGTWALQRAARDAAIINGMGLEYHVPIAVNLSARQFSQPNFVGLIRHSLMDAGIKPKDLELEITESLLIGEDQRHANKLGMLYDMGCVIAIDDFGTGYSALSYLKDYPFAKLKIDRAFITQIGKSRSADNLLIAIIGMARALGMKVVAEGVETTRELSFLQAHGCDLIQGYLFSKPVNFAMFLDIIDAQAPLQPVPENSQIES